MTSECPDIVLSELMKFLRETLACEKLSVAADMQRLLLIHKFKFITDERDEKIAANNAGYMDMSSPSKDKPPSEPECYEELDGSSERDWSPSSSLPSNCSAPPFYPPTNRLSVRSEPTNQEPPYENIARNGRGRYNTLEESTVTSVSASALKYTADKCGYLSRKEKILFVEHAKKYWAAVSISTNNLYLYAGEKDGKPVSTISLEKYAAREIDSGSTEKKEYAFEIVCPGKKTYQFNSASKSDLDDWITSINRVSGQNPHHRDHAKMQQKRLSERNSRVLPCPPLCEETSPMFHYDRPNPIIRPVSQPVTRRQQETLYHYISEDVAEEYYYLKPRPPQECYYNNVDASDCCERVTVAKPGDTLYYNLLPNGTTSTNDQQPNSNNNNDDETESEEITCLPEEKPVEKSANNYATEKCENEGDTFSRNGMSKIQRIIKHIEEISHRGGNTSAERRTMIHRDPHRSRDQLYELVSKSHTTLVNV